MKKLITISALLLATIITILGFISPDGVSLPTYLLILSFVYAFFVFTIFIILKLFYSDMSKAKLQFIAIIFGFIPVGVLALGSLSQLTFLDTLLVIAVPLLIVWYATKRGIIK